MKIVRFLRSVAIALALSCPAAAQSYHDTGGTAVRGVVIVDPTDNSGPLFTTANPGHVSGSFSASLGGFTPSSSGARMAQLTVTTSDSSQTLPTGSVVVVSNVGANPMYCNVNGVTATTSDELIPASSWFAFTVPGGVTALHCIATGGPTTANGVGGAGLPTGAGGGGGSGGSLSWPGTASATNYGTAPSGTVPAVNADVTNALTIGTLPAIPSGSNTIGAVTQSGTWTVSLPTGAATAANQEVTTAGTSASSAQAVQGVTGGVAMPVTPKTQAFTFPGCTVGTTSAQCLAASTATNHIQVQNTSTSATLACSWGGTAALNSSSSFQLAAGQSALWGAATSGVPSQALNCISSAASTPVYLEYN